VIFSFVAVFIVTFVLLGNYYCGHPREVTVLRRVRRRSDHRPRSSLDPSETANNSIDPSSLHPRKIEQREPPPPLQGQGQQRQEPSQRAQPSQQQEEEEDEEDEEEKEHKGGVDRAAKEIVSLKVRLTYDLRRKLINRYIEELFLDIDYNLLVIFTGLFIVSGSFVSTGIPGAIWNAMAGRTAFRDTMSVFLISVYTIVASQLVGNVPLVYMASNEIAVLDDNTQRFGWIVMAWVSTVAGNFMLTGSAANIIVAEKASRHTTCPVVINAKDHFMVCGLMTLVCIVLGTVIIYLECKGLGYI
jgi:hypothetical protein